MKKRKKELDSELNLISFVSLLSVLICSLLLTAIWIHIGSMNVKQAVGGQAADPSKKNKETPSLWTQLHPDGSLKFILKDFPASAKRWDNQRIPGIEGEVDQKSTLEYLKALKSLVPELRMALFQPQGEVLYGKIISLMDDFKQQGFVDLGVVPL